MNTDRLMSDFFDRELAPGTAPDLRSLSDDDKRSTSNLLTVLQQEHPAAYVDAVIRLAAIHHITWQKGMGLR